jgi:hypothetical protein
MKTEFLKVPPSNTSLSKLESVIFMKTILLLSNSKLPDENDKSASHAVELSK